MGTATLQLAIIQSALLDGPKNLNSGEICWLAFLAQQVIE